MTIKDNPIRVLLVEDNPGDSRLVEIMLTEAGDGAFKVDTAARLAEAEAALAEAMPDVVLLDLGLPDSAGLGTAQRMLEAAPNVPIVVLTGLDDEEIGVNAVHQGVQDYLVKGHIDAAVVRRAVRYAIDRHAAFQVLRHQLVFQQQMIDALPIPVFYTDAGLAVLGCNRAFEALIGRPRHELLGGLVFEVLPAGLAERFDEDDLGEVGRECRLEAAFEGPDGRCRTTLAKTAFHDVEGNLAGLVVTVTAGS